MFLCLKFFVTLHPKLSKMKILITGASGFIGSFIVEEALRRGFETWAAVRKSSSREWLKDERINFIELNLSSKEQLKEQLKDKTEPLVEGAAERAVERQSLRLCGACRWCDEVSEQTGLPTHQHRGHQESGGRPAGGEDALKATGLREQPQRVWCHQGAAAL